MCHCSLAPLAAPPPGCCWGRGHPAPRRSRSPTRSVAHGQPSPPTVTPAGPLRNRPATYPLLDPDRAQRPTHRSSPGESGADTISIPSTYSDGLLRRFASRSDSRSGFGARQPSRSSGAGSTDGSSIEPPREPDEETRTPIRQCLLQPAVSTARSNRADQKVGGREASGAVGAGCIRLFMAEGWPTSLATCTGAKRISSVGAATMWRSSRMACTQSV